jgi:hypothetical protein
MPVKNKILAYFFLTFLLVGLTSNLHVYSHHDVSSIQIDLDKEKDNHDEDEPSCDICLLALQLNQLDYLDTDNDTDFQNPSTTLIASVENLQTHGLFIFDYNLECDKNKAPPYSC